jgi:hypothetical protein
VGNDTEYEPPFVHGEQGDRSAQVIQIDTGKHIAVVAICSALCGIAAVFAGWSAFQATYATKRSDMLQYYVMELDGKLMASGVIKYEESWAAQQRQKEK